MSKKVLVVDDSISVRETLKKLISERGCDVLEGNDGENGHLVLTENPDIALIISDYYMPNLNGIEMVAKIRQNERFADLPCFILSSVGPSNKELIHAAKHAGVTGWLGKPILAQDIELLLNKFCA